jgi:NAD(P)-dependent dehydrogenase (short-subunit alcohol dehydrogenase family)
VLEAVRQLGGLDIVVNNAARQHSADSILDLTTEQFDWTFKTNVYAMFWITKAAVPHLKPGSCIINTASAQAYDPSPNLLDYAQTKSAQVAFTKALAKQLGKQGIRVNAIAPGPIWTPLQVSGEQTQENLKKFGQDSPLGRPGQPAELALAFVTLAADESSYTTGQVYGVAGGKATRRQECRTSAPAQQAHEQGGERHGRDPLGQRAWMVAARGNGHVVVSDTLLVRIITKLSSLCAPCRIVSPASHAPMTCV